MRITCAEQNNPYSRLTPLMSRGMAQLTKKCSRYFGIYKYFPVEAAATIPYRFNRGPLHRVLPAI